MGAIFLGGIAQLGERLPCKQEVTSSNLVISIANVYIDNVNRKVKIHVP